MNNLPGGPESRSNAHHCTHPRLTRFFDDYNSQKCTVCETIPENGALFRCTSLVNDSLVEPEMAIFEHDMRKYNIGPLAIGNAVDVHGNGGDLNYGNGSNGTGGRTRHIPAPATHREDRNFARPFTTRSRSATTPACGFQVCQPCRSTGGGGGDRSGQSVDNVVRSASTGPAPDARAVNEQRGQYTAEYTAATARTLAAMQYGRQPRFSEHLPDRAICDSQSHSAFASVSNHTSDRRSEQASSDATNRGMSHDTVLSFHHGVSPYHMRVGTDDPRGPVSGIIAPPPTPASMPLLSPRRSRASLRESVDSKGSSDRGSYHDEATIKAKLQKESEQEVARIPYLDDEGREHLPEARLGAGRFYID